MLDSSAILKTIVIYSIWIVLYLRFFVWLFYKKEFTDLKAYRFNKEQAGILTRHVLACSFGFMIPYIFYEKLYMLPLLAIAAGFIVLLIRLRRINVMD